MKRYLRILTLLMALFLLFTVFVGCDQEDVETNEETDEDDDPVEDFFPDVERNNYGEDVNIYMESSSNPNSYFLLKDEDDNDGSPMDEAVYNRQEKVNKYLGVNLTLVQTADSGITWNTYIKLVESAIKNMDSTVEVVVTHVYACVAGMISENYLLDLGEFEGIDLEAEYWNMEFMDTLELNGNYFLGLSDFNILYTYVIAFNKNMLDLYDSHLDKSIYDLVIDYEWTLDEMISLSSLVYLDATGNGKTTDDTFGITGTCWVPFAGFLTASNIPMLAQDESGAYSVAINNELNASKADDLITKLRDLGSSNNAYFDYDYNKLSVPLTGGRALMQIASTYALPSFLDYNIEFGVVPVPMYDLDQASVGYKSLQWGGYIGVLSYLKNPTKIAETLELLAFYSENVKITFYEKLLGKQVADMPDDAAMLEIVWDSVSTDVGQTFVGAGTDSTMGVCYTVPQLMWPNSTQNLASYIKSQENAVNNGFKTFLRQIKN